MEILSTGLSGLVGSRLRTVLSSDFNFEDLSISSGVDITNANIMEEKISASRAEWVFHFAAMTDVDQAEKERNLGQESRYWKVNVDATKSIVELCKRLRKKLVYISTDYVFDGTQTYYTETDEPHPKGFYGYTKYAGELHVLSLSKGFIIARIANPYGPHPKGKGDFVHKIISALAEEKHVIAPYDQIFVPTLIDDIAHALARLVLSDASGIYHVVGDTALSPYEAACEVADVFGYHTSVIAKTTFDEYFQDKAPRPLRAHIKNDKIKKLGISMHSFREGLEQIRTTEKNSH